MRTLLALAGALGTCLAACSGTDPPAQSHVALDFPSTQLAVVTDSIGVQVYDVGAVASFYKTPAEDACLNLLQARRTGQQLPPPSFDTHTISVCQYLANKGPAMALGYGERAFLVVGLDGNQKELLIGCARSSVGDASQTIDVPLTLFSKDTAVPTTTCTQVSQKCSGGC